MKSSIFHIFLFCTLIQVNATVKKLPIIVNTWAFLNATSIAWDTLYDNNSAIDAIENGCKTCEQLQCDGTVGFGGSPDENGETTLDAMIMDGSNLNIGAVAGLRCIKDAISVARYVLEHTKHSFLVGDQATQFAMQMGFKKESLNTQNSFNIWKKWTTNNCQPNFWTNVYPDPRKQCGPYHPISSRISENDINYFNSMNHDTIGMIAIDKNGGIATGTSTNGASHKIPGRVGDSPVPGAGAYADNEVGAAAATGDGDIMMRVLPSFLAVEQMRSGKSPREAAEIAIKRIIKRYPVFFGGIIAVNKDGDYGAACHGMDTFPFAGANISQLERDIGSDQFPPNEHYFGLVNFGNTCYSNSVLQALYFCKPFREKVLEYKAKNKRTKETLLTCLADLFYSIATQKKKVGSIAPKKFIARLRKEKEEFDNYMQQDAHEFLNFLINHINEIILAERQQNNSSKTKLTSSDNGQPNAEPTWVHEIFQGILTSETRCLNCETVSSKDEDFFDLQVDVDQNTSITHCLKCWSNTETLCSDNKFKCDNCSSYQEAQKRMRVKKLPMILALHLKRFKYMEQYNRHIKVSHRVVFPLELRLFNTSDDAVNPDRLYDLVAVVIHCGSGPNRGHYISIVKSHGFWLLFDDDMVDKIDASTIEDFYGLTSDIQKSSETGYILFYQSRDCS